jgi:hypothetical protein
MPTAAASLLGSKSSSLTLTDAEHSQVAPIRYCVQPEAALGTPWPPRYAGYASRVGVLTADDGHTVSVDSQHKLTEYARRRAGAALQTAGIATDWRTASTGALLATYLDHHRTTKSKTPAQLCACGCGQPVKRGRRGPRPKWHSDAYRKRATRAGPRRS